LGGKLCQVHVRMTENLLLQGSAYWYSQHIQYIYVTDIINCLLIYSYISTLFSHQGANTKPLKQSKAGVFSFVFYLFNLLLLCSKHFFLNLCGYSHRKCLNDTLHKRSMSNCCKISLVIHIIQYSNRMFLPLKRQTHHTIWVISWSMWKSHWKLVEEWKPFTSTWWSVRLIFYPFSFCILFTVDLILVFLMLSKCCTTEQHSSPLFLFLIGSKMNSIYSGT
jgi:hypothetical protein